VWLYWDITIPLTWSHGILLYALPGLVYIYLVLKDNFSSKLTNWLAKKLFFQIILCSFYRQEKLFCTFPLQIDKLWRKRTHIKPSQRLFLTARVNHVRGNYKEIQEVLVWKEKQSKTFDLWTSGKQRKSWFLLCLKFPRFPLGYIKYQRIFDFDWENNFPMIWVYERKQKNFLQFHGNICSILVTLAFLISWYIFNANVQFIHIFLKSHFGLLCRAFSCSHT